MWIWEGHKDSVHSTFLFIYLYIVVIVTSSQIVTRHQWELELLEWLTEAQQLSWLKVSQSVCRLRIFLPDSPPFFLPIRVSTYTCILAWEHLPGLLWFPPFVLHGHFPHTSVHTEAHIGVCFSEDLNWYCLFQKKGYKMVGIDTGNMTRHLI